MAVTVSWLQFDTNAASVDVRVSWLAFDTQATVEADGQVYGGKKRRGPVDDLTIDHVRKQWEYLEEKAAREVSPAPASKVAAQETAPATAPATLAKVAAAASVLPLPASIKLTNPKGEIVSARDIAAMVQGLELQRIELEVVVTRARRAAEDALILALLND